MFHSWLTIIQLPHITNKVFLCPSQLVDRVFDESLNFRKIPPMVQNKAPEINGRPVELRPRAPDSLDSHSALRRRTWNRDEAVVDSLLLTSVSQLSAKIRQSVDKTAGKIR